MTNKSKTRSFRDKINDIIDTKTYAGLKAVEYPDPDIYALTNWTYEDIKNEVAALMKKFDDMGFKLKEAMELTYNTLRLAAYNDEGIKEFTENIMSATAIMLYCSKTREFIDADLRQKYSKLLDRWTTSHYKGYKLSLKDEEALENDIVSMLELIERYGDTSQPDYSVSVHDFLLDARPERWNRNLASGHVQMYISGDDKPCIEYIQKQLSPEAFLLITRFERDYYSPNRYKFVVESNGMKITPETQRFFDLYDGRSFIYRDATFYIDYHCGNNKFKGCTTGNDIAAFLNNNYYLLIMSYLNSEDKGVFIDMYGRIYDYSHGFITFAANSFEEFLELNARRSESQWVMINARKEIEQKYFIPEIRLLSIKRIRRGVHV